MTGGITVTSPRNVLREYMRYTKRDIGTVLNTASFYIARGAVRNTKKVSAVAIKAELEKKLAPENGPTDLGKFFESQYPEISKRYRMSRTVRVGDKDVPLVALLINWKRGKSGQKGLQGQDMQAAADKFVASRAKSSGAIAAGFLPSVKVFEPLAYKKNGAAPVQTQVQQYGPPKGYGLPARGEDVIQRAVISNFAQSPDDMEGRGLTTYGGAGLQLAIDDEFRNMERIAYERMQATANKFNAR